MRPRQKLFPLESLIKPLQISINRTLRKRIQHMSTSARRRTLNHTPRRKAKLPRLAVKTSPRIPMILRQIGPTKTPPRPSSHIHLHPKRISLLQNVLQGPNPLIRQKRNIPILITLRPVDRNNMCRTDSPRLQILKVPVNAILIPRTPRTPPVRPRPVPNPNLKRPTPITTNSQTMKTASNKKKYHHENAI